MSLNLRSLIGKLTDTTRRGLEGAAGLCLSRTHYEVEIEHWLLKLLEEADGDLSRILRRFDVLPDRVARELTAALDRKKTGSKDRPDLSTDIEDLAREAWVLASINHGAQKVRSGLLLLALLSDRDLRRHALESSKELGRVNVETLAAELPKIVAGAREEREVLSAGGAAPEGEGGAAAAGSASPALDQYTVDLTARARAGHLDPVLGREAEVRQIVDILTRRRQNNPILTGEAGVGKTAVVEGFALRIAAGDVPPPLRAVALRSLDLGLLQAGAGVKGEFENRLKQVIEEVRASAQPIILFIDEAHTLIGAGGQAGQNDAANLLKPALARGELRTIAATTWAEYKKYFEKDAALSRRFQVVKVEEPVESQAIVMMRGIKPKLEEHHQVRILDEAVIESVRLSQRYLAGRQLPDKSVSVLDTACARVGIGQSAVPASVEDTRRRIENLRVEIQVLERETASGADHAERLAAAREALGAEEKRLKSLEERWGKEKEQVAKLLEIQTKLEETAAKDPAGGKKLLEELERRRKELRALQGEEPLVQPQIDGQTVAAVISAWTGIPVGRMVADEVRTVLELPSRLGERVIGQDHALEVIAQRVQTSRARLDNPGRPVGVFMLVGPSGVGKTETAIALSEALYGGERNLITINMSEFQEAHTVSSLKGSPPGYVGYGEGGVLTEAVRRRPYSVVLLDEVEKAHPDVHEIFFQVFDKGQMEDGEGREIDFKNTIIILTSNCGTDTVMKLSADPETRPDPEALAKALRPDLLKVFPPAFLGRLVVVPYYPISGEPMKKIVRLQLTKIARRLRENHRAELVFDDALIEAVIRRATETESGARNIDHILTRNLLPRISAEILARSARGERFTRVKVGVDAQNAFTHELQ